MICVFTHPHTDESRGLRTWAAQAEAVALTAAQRIPVTEAERAHLTAVTLHSLHIGLNTHAFTLVLCAAVLQLY